MTSGDRRRTAADEVAGAACCRRPVRLWGTTVEPGTGELGGRRFLVACKDRRALLCPACAQRYQADAFHLVVSGLRGGKGVPASVAGHPACFLTLTAPSFGPVHSRPATEKKDAVCRPRRDASRCAHGVARSCKVRHEPGDPRLGTALCARCFDYEGAVVWNARVSLLWQRTSVLMRRAVAAVGGLTARQQAEVFRFSYVKVVEFQRRGLVHLHVVVRADGPEGSGDPPPAWLDGPTLLAGVEEAVARANVPAPLGESGGTAVVRWGEERTARVVEGQDHNMVAAYLAKYAVKTATDEAGLVHRIDGDPGRALRRADPHTAALVEAAWRLGARPELSSLRLRAHAHTFGYGGHFATKSRLWSTTFGALRAARARHAREAAGASDDFLEGSFSYLGRGYFSPEADGLAEVLAEAIATRPRRVPATSPSPSSRGPYGR